MRSSAGEQRFLERRRDDADEVSNRTERTRNREVVAAAEEHPGLGFERSHELGYERGLADPRLAGDEDHAPVAPRRRVARPGERSQCPIALEELHGARIDLRGKAEREGFEPSMHLSAPTRFPVAQSNDGYEQRGLVELSVESDQAPSWRSCV